MDLVDGAVLAAQIADMNEKLEVMCKLVMSLALKSYQNELVSGDDILRLSRAVGNKFGWQEYGAWDFKAPFSYRRVHKNGTEDRITD